MEIRLENISKRFGRHWVLREVSHTIAPGSCCAITGPNGSGKSTLLRIISGGMAPSGGQVHFLTSEGNRVHWSDAAARVSFTAPYVDLVERLTLKEHIEFHFRFRKSAAGMSSGDIMTRIGLYGDRDKQVRDFSSGMKQRLKLALAFYTDCEVVLLDEPTSNLDAQWSDWYEEEVRMKAGAATVVVASNHPAEYAFCSEVLDVVGSVGRKAGSE